MIIIQDTREQRPLDFKPHQAVVEIAKLDTGDYSVKGRELDICVERKSIEDLVNTLVRAKKRFSAEMDRMRSIRYRCILVEGSMRDLKQHRYRSKIHENAILGLINWVQINTETPVVWADDPVVAAWWVESWFRQVLKREEKNATSHHGLGTAT